MTIHEFKNNFTWDFDNTDLIEECRCYKPNCLQRKINIFDEINGNWIGYKLCDSIVKLYYENVDYRLNEERHYSDFVESICIDYLKNKYGFITYSSCQVWRFFNSKKIHERYFCVLESDKPYFSLYMNLKEALEFLVSNNNRTYGYFLLNKIKKCINKFFEDNDFKKNKNLQLEIKRELKKINTFTESYKNEIIDILNKIIILISKNK